MSISATDFRALQATFVPRPDAPGHGRLFFWCMPPRNVEYARKALTTLGILRRGKTPPTGPINLVIPTPTRNKTEDWEIAELKGIRLPMVETVRGLVRLDLNEARRRRVSDSVRVWAMAAKLAVELIASQQLVPLLHPGDETRGPYARWGIANASSETRERIRQLADALPIAGHALVMEPGQATEPTKTRKKNRRRRRRKLVSEDTTVWNAESLIQAFLDAVADAISREAMPSSSKDRPRKDNRSLAPWELRWRYALTAADSSFEYAGLIEQPLFEQNERWVAPVRPRALGGTPYSVAYQLELPGQSPETADVPNAWFLRYQLQANDDPSVMVDAAQVWASPARAYQHGARVFVHPHESLLQSLAETARLFDPVRRSLRGSKPAGVVLSTEEAWQFISTVAPILAQFGIAVLVPRALRAEGQQRLRLKLQVGHEGGWDRPGDSKVGIRGLTDFRWQVALGEVDLTADEFREIAALKQPLVQWRGQWLAVDPGELAQMETLFDNAQTVGEIDRTAALAAALNGSLTGVDGSSAIEVVAQGEVHDLVESLRNTESFEDVAAPSTFKGELRPYQARGLTWLVNMNALGFGVCLADDMGLGKTIQVIAALLHHAEQGTWGDTPALLVCPTSVLGNWERELKRFAPSLRVIRHHGRNRDASLAELKKKGKGRNTVVLTTYVLARMDIQTLSRTEWSHLIIDEAQNIKNPQAQQAVAIRKIPAQRRIALTGTPIENRLMELWSILEFANPGLLGSASDFRRRFALPVERFGDRKAADTLRRMVNPFILRRVKTDPNVIQDLPEKQEYRVFCTLTREQATLYQATVDAALEKIEGSSGVKRRGNILALLTGLKQIGNHPSHYIKDWDEPGHKLRNRSGKLTRLTEMMEEVIAENDHALIFTQYTEMGELLVRHFRDTFDFEMPFIHGGVPAEQRDRIVRDFQEDPDAPPALLLSLKAGGTGLNLTRATHVFHFDRWWNPAVEDQATDRAYRVGQTRNVQVHKLICTGTVEEKIDEILESKRDLADQVVGDGESWITELDDTELRELFSLGSSIAIDDDAEARA